MPLLEVKALAWSFRPVVALPVSWMDVGFSLDEARRSAWWVNPVAARA
jgi:hypothetical protein